MPKKVAVLAVNPVNGFGLFQYLETFFEKKIPYKTFAVSVSTAIKTNSGVNIQTDALISDLKGHEQDFDALVFACGDAIPVFAQNAGTQYNQDMLAVIKKFNELGKIIIGHCGAGMLADMTGIGTGKKVAVHPFVKSFLKKAIGTDDAFNVDGNLYTAQTENTISSMIPTLLGVLK
ncbi:MAG: DJ-1/PfpI family protein [Ignavibacteria bacterium]|jgi:putative intracellular protease/amidase|nr:DJ-1/PfpI family protein [Ignavibacteria bacterium]